MRRVGGGCLELNPTGFFVLALFKGDCRERLPSREGVRGEMGELPREKMCREEWEGERLGGTVPLVGSEIGNA